MQALSSHGTFSGYRLVDNEAGQYKGDTMALFNADG